MTNRLKRRLQGASVLINLGAIGAVTTAATAMPVSSMPAESTSSAVRFGAIPTTPDADELVGQVTSVSQLSDVKPTDWAFQALQSLVERYGCIVGYPDKTFRGNRALSRYEFAAGLNACLDRVNELIAAATSELAKKEDLESIQRLQEEFAAELAGIRGRVDALEVRTATLEKQQFSTTTKLQGEVIFAIADVFGEERALNSDNWRVIEAAPPATRNNVEDALLTNRSFVFPNGTVGSTTTSPVGTRGTGANAGATARATRSRGGDVNTIFANRVRLNLITSFTGKDRLLTRLEANNTTAFGSALTGTNQTRLGWDATNNVDNSVQLGKANYQFPIGDSLNVIIDGVGGEFFSNFYTFNPYFENPATGAVSRFGRFSPIYRTSNTGSGSNNGSGISANLRLGKSFTFSAGYLARRASDPSDKRGLFDGTYAAIAQLAYQPTRDFGIGLTYSHAYYSGFENDVTISGAYGTGFANQPFGAGVGSTAANPRGVPTTTNNFGLQANYRIFPGFAISAWGLYTQAIAEDGSDIAFVNTGDSADVWSWAVGLAFPDLLKKGNLGGIIVGQTPRVTSNDYGPPVLAATTPRREDSDSSFHVEALYRFQITNTLSITPGFFVVFNPEGNSNNDPLYVGVIRTTFRF